MGNMSHFSTLIRHEESTDQSNKTGGMSQPVNQLILNKACIKTPMSLEQAMMCNGMPMYPPKPIPSDLLQSPGKHSGIIMGRFTNLLNWSKDVSLPEGREGHFILIGSPGSGKTSGVIIPSILIWEGPFVVIDVKGDIQQAYDAYDQKNHKVIELAPQDPNGISVDPFDLLRYAPEGEQIALALEIARIIVPENPASNEHFWDDSERQVLAGLLYAYYLMRLDFPMSISRILGQSLKSAVEEVSILNDIRVDQFLGEIDKMDTKTVTGIDRGLRNKLLKFSGEEAMNRFFRGRGYADKVFSWDELDNPDSRPLAVFIRIPEEKVENWGSGIILLLTMLFRHLMCRPEMHSSARQRIKPCLVAIDEFPRFGQLPMIIPALSTLRSKSVNILLAVQSLAQLDSIYGSKDRATLVDNCGYRVIFRVQDPENQKLIADMIGKMQVCSLSLSSTWASPGSVSINFGTRDAYIVEPADLASLNDVIIATPFGTFRIEKSLRIQLPSISKADDERRSCYVNVNTCSAEQIAAEAEDCVLKYRQNTGTGITSMDAVAKYLGKKLITFLPTFYDAVDNEDGLKKFCNHIANDKELMSFLQGEI